MFFSKINFFDLSIVCVAAIDIKGRGEIISSVRIVRKASIASNAVQSLYLGLFLVTYTVDCAYYLPFLWSISCSVTTFNFIRNRHYVHSKLLCGARKTEAPSPTADDADMVSVIRDTTRARPPSEPSHPSHLPVAHHVHSLHGCASKLPRPLTILVDHAEPLATGIEMHNFTPTGTEGTPC